MGGDFQNLPLEDVCLGIYDCPHSTPELSETGPFMVRTQDIRQGFFDTSSAVHVNEEAYVERTKRVSPRYGDILFSREGTYFGDAAEVPENVRVCLGQRMVLLRPNPEVINPTYLRIQINSPVFQSMLSQYRDGTVAERLNLPVIRSLPVKVPFIKAQENVVAKIVCLEQKIEINRQMNATLEAMAQALFKSWFVDFDPVIDNALTAGCPIPEELQARAEARMALGDKRKPLPEAIQKQFPSRFVFTEEMGWVPEGWEVATIGDQVETSGGGTPSTKEAAFWEGGTHAFCTPKDMSQLSSIVLMDTERHLTDAGVSKISSGKLPQGTVLMSSRAPIGYLAISDVPVSVNQGIIAMLPNARFGPLYLLCWAKKNMDRIKDRANGSTFMEISKKNFRPIPFLVPGEEVLRWFNCQAEGIYSKILLISEQITALAKLRDTLLPKLLSGELRIPDAEKVASEAV